MSPAPGVAPLRSRPGGEAQAGVVCALTIGNAGDAGLLEDGR